LDPSHAGPRVRSARGHSRTLAEANSVSPESRVARTQVLRRLGVFFRGAMNVRPKEAARPKAMVLVGLATAFAVAGAAASAASSSLGSDAPHRPLHLPHLLPGKRCPISPSQTARWGTDGLQTLTGRGPAYLIGGGRISIALSARDSLGWYGQKTPWAIRRSYAGPILVRGARIGRRGQVRFAYGYGDHLRELHWDAGADQGLPADPGFRFLASGTLFRGAGCYAYQIDGSSFSKIIVVRVTR
jgi:hypothetical protein